MELCILAGTKNGDLVLDPFIGSGTTAIVAKKRHRNFLGFELIPKYSEMAISRIENIVSNGELFS